MREKGKFQKFEFVLLCVKNPNCQTCSLINHCLQKLLKKSKLNANIFFIK